MVEFTDSKLKTKGRNFIRWLGYNLHATCPQRRAGHRRREKSSEEQVLSRMERMILSRDGKEGAAVGAVGGRGEPATEVWKEGDLPDSAAAGSLSHWTCGWAHLRTRSVSGR